MRHYDLAIHGFGLLPGLLAVHLLGRDPGQSLLLLSGDATICGEVLEPVVSSSLSPAALELIEPFAVARWPGYYITRDQATEHRTDEVLLIDPVQVWLELEGLLAPQDMIVTGGELTCAGNRLIWPDGAAESAQLVDLAQITRRDQSSEIVGLEAARSLPLPVLADFDTGHEPWDAFQHVPLGDDRVYVRKRQCRGDSEAELTVSLGRLLSDLIAF